jgi:hypothetical protein
MTHQFTIPGGREKGATLTEASVDSLGWWANTIAGNLEEGKSKYPDRDQAWLDAARAEQARRHGGAPAQQSQQAPQGQQRQAPPSRQAPPQQRQAPRNGNGSALARTPQAQIVAGHFADPNSVNAMLEQAMATTNLIAPATVCGALPEGCEIAVSLVSVDLAKNQWGYSSGDVYSVGSGKIGLSKSVLDRISAASGITWDANRCRRLDDGSDPYYCMFVAVGHVRNFDGTVREISGTKEMDLREESAQIEALYERAKGTKADGSDRKDPTKQIREMRLHILGHAETKAKLRAIRSVGIKTSYTEDELRKPFSVARMTWTGRTDDPELRRMFAEKTADAMLGSMTALYGGQQAPALPAARRPPPLPSRRFEDDDHGYVDSDGVACNNEPAPAPQPQAQDGGLPPDQDRGPDPNSY